LSSQSSSEHETPFVFSGAATRPLNALTFGIAIIPPPDTTLKMETESVADATFATRETSRVFTEV